MLPIGTPKTNVTHEKPELWDDARGQCAALPSYRIPGGFRSAWHANWKERLAILFGRPVMLTVLCSQHPPVMIGVGD